MEEIQTLIKDPAAWLIAASVSVWITIWSSTMTPVKVNLTAVLCVAFATAGVQLISWVSSQSNPTRLLIFLATILVVGILVYYTVWADTSEKPEVTAIRPKFSSQQFIRSIVDPNIDMTLNKTINLDNVGTLTVLMGGTNLVLTVLNQLPALHVPDPERNKEYSGGGGTAKVAETIAGHKFGFAALRMNSGQPYEFVPGKNHIHDVEVGGRTFRVTLNGVTILRTAGGKPMDEYDFSVSEL